MKSVSEWGYVLEPAYPGWDGVELVIEAAEHHHGKEE
jgi:hypothetical protein